MNNKKDDRVRNWSFILYPDSAPETWRDVLEDYHVRTIISPLHDLDIDKNGKPKKIHYHVLVMFDGKKSFSQIKEMYTDVLSCTIPQKVESVRSLTRYFCHLDDPEKAQYNPADLIAYGGVDLDALLRPSEVETAVLIHEIVKFIQQNDITEYCDLWAYVLDNDLNEWIPIIAKYSYCFNTFLRSKKFKLTSLN